MRDINIDCGCFGAANPEKLGWGLVARDVGLFACCALVLAASDASWARLLRRGTKRGEDREESHRLGLTGAVGARHAVGMLRRLLGLALALTIVLIVAGPANATLIEALDMRQLVQGADSIILGTVVAQHARYDDRGRIVTDVTFDVEDTMKGSASSPEVVLTVFGGDIGDLGMRIAGEPGLSDGDRAIVFGRGVDSAAAVGGPFRPVGMSQGVLPVTTQSGRDMVWPGGAGLALVQRAGGQLRSAPPAMAGPEPLADVMTEHPRPRGRDRSPVG